MCLSACQSKCHKKIKLCCNISIFTTWTTLCLNDFHLMPETTIKTLLGQCVSWLKHCLGKAIDLCVYCFPAIWVNICATHIMISMQTYFIFNRALSFKFLCSKFDAFFEVIKLKFTCYNIYMEIQWNSENFSSQFNKIRMKA